MKIIHIESGLGNQMLSYCEYLAIKKMNPQDDCYIETIIYDIPECNDVICQWNGYELDKVFNLHTPNIHSIINSKNWNQLIINNISGCRELFPESINWEYIKSIFIMPDGLSEKGIKREAQKYYTNINSYPYQVYMGVLIPNNGNILFNDEKFIKLLYQANNDEFRRSDILSQTDDKSQILLEDFILNHKKTVIAIDTEKRIQSLEQVKEKLLRLNIR